MTYGIIVRDGTNTPRTISAIQVRDGTNTPREISEIRVRDSNNVSRIVFSLAPPLSASASPETVYGSASIAVVVTNSTTVTPVGGVPPYTYDWSLESYTAVTPPEPVNPNSATTGFIQSGLEHGESSSANWICLVTDDDGNTASAPCQSFWTRT